MRRFVPIPLILSAAALLACGDARNPLQPVTGGPPPVLLKDMVVANLPSPYYHFEYEPGGGGQISKLSFASGFFEYSVQYLGSRILELQNDALGNSDRLLYHYDLSGRVDEVDYVDPAEQVVGRVRLTYAGDQLTELDRETDFGTGLTPDKTMTFSYYADGNLETIVDHRPAVGGSPETTSVDHFEQYDDQRNVDAFGLIHNDFFDHVVLLPNVQLQRGNPARETFTSADINYRFDYTYEYDSLQRPLVKGGTATVLSGPDSGQVIPLRTAYTYY